MEKPLVSAHLIELAETPSTVRYLLSDGTVIDVHGHHADSGDVRSAILKATGAARVVGEAWIERGGWNGAAINIEVWDSASDETERVESSTTSPQRSETTTTTKKPRLSPETRRVIKAKAKPLNPDALGEPLETIPACEMVNPNNYACTLIDGHAGPHRWADGR